MLGKNDVLTEAQKVADLTQEDKGGLIWIKIQITEGREGVPVTKKEKDG